MSTMASRYISTARRTLRRLRTSPRDSEVSLTVNLAYTSWKDIHGLSIGGRAKRVIDPQEVDQASQLMFERFPQIARYAPAELEDIVLFRVTPKVISVLDYRKGFDHSDLVKL